MLSSRNWKGPESKGRTSDLGDVDLFGEVPGGGVYRNLLQESIEVRLTDDASIHVIDLDALIRLKNAAGRARDLEAVAELIHIKEERKRVSFWLAGRRWYGLILQPYVAHFLVSLAFKILRSRVNSGMSRAREVETIIRSAGSRWKAVGSRAISAAISWVIGRISTVRG